MLLIVVYLDFRSTAAGALVFSTNFCASWTARLLQFLLDFPRLVRGRHRRPAAKKEEQNAMRKTKNGLYCYIWKLEHENARTLEYSTRLDSACLARGSTRGGGGSQLFDSRLSTLRPSTSTPNSQLPTPNAQLPTPSNPRLSTLDSRLATRGSQRLSEVLDSTRRHGAFGATDSASPGL